jgi:hypothetical protein
MITPLLMNLRSAFSAHGTAESFLKKRGIWLLLAFALCYYGYYFNVWPGPGGEGGVDALLSLRLLQGQRPIVDTFLGYNVLWFYPIVGIFKVLGPHYLAMRIFFFSLCLITGLFSYGIVLKTSGRAWVALLTGVLVILVPGQTYRNYMAFIVVVNMSLFLSALVLPARTPGRRMLRILGAGLTLGMAFLVRIDVGYFLSFILLGLLAVYPVWNPDRIRARQRLLVAVGGLLLVATALLATHAPFYRESVHRGYSSEFIEQYRSWPRMISIFGMDMVRGAASLLPSNATPRPAAPSDKAPMNRTATTSLPPQQYPGAASLKITHGAQERISIRSPKIRDKIMALNLYLPIVVAFFLTLGASAVWIASLISGSREAGATSLESLTALGCSLCLFPQYFFWQPNMVHLSEFMVPMTIATMLSCIAAAGLVARGGIVRLAAAAYLALAATALVLYYVNACQSGGAGGIAVSQHKRFPFHASNGTDVVMNEEEFELNSALRDLINAVSDPGEFVICYPYQPEVNFYTDRPSYEKNVYADNDIPGDKFHANLLANEAKNHPAVFVLDNWDINGTEESRFYNWAWKSYRHLSRNYLLAYRHGDFEVYVRPDRADRIPERFRSMAKTSPTP